MLEKVKVLYEKSPKEFFFRIVTTLLSSLIMPKIVLLMFLVYMSNSGFFSYDFFVDGLFGMKLFFLISVIIVLFFGFMMFGSIVFIIGDIKKHLNVWCIIKKNLLLILLNIVVLLMTIGLAFDNMYEWTWALYLCIISLFICIHIGIMFFHNAKKQFSSFLFFIFMCFFTVVNFADETSKVLSMGLKTFSVGGNVKAEILTKDKKRERGYLTLMTPKFIFFKPLQRNGIKIYSISNIENIYIGKDLKLE